MMMMTLDIEDPDALREYLYATQRVAPREDLMISRLGGGVSSRTMLVTRTCGEKWVAKQALEKLRVSVDWFSDPRRVHHEALAIGWLNRVLPAGAVPSLVFEDAAQHLLVMTFAPEPHGNWKTQLLSGCIEADSFRQYGAYLGLIHRAGCAGDANLPAELYDPTLFESLRLEPYYLYSAERVPQAASFLRDLVVQTRQRQDAFVHGDYSPKNVLVRDHRLILLDHEVAHIGDPGFDVGFALAHLLSKAHYCAERRDDFAAGASHFWDAYLTALGATPWRDEIAIRAIEHTLGCLLGRVAGRSTLEYLDQRCRDRQSDVVCALIGTPPSGVLELISEFTQRIQVR